MDKIQKNPQRYTEEHLKEEKKNLTLSPNIKNKETKPLGLPGRCFLGNWEP